MRSPSKYLHLIQLIYIYIYKINVVPGILEKKLILIARLGCLKSSTSWRIRPGVPPGWTEMRIRPLWTGKKYKIFLTSKLKNLSYRASRQRLKRVSRSGNNSETGSLSSETEIY